MRNDEERIIYEIVVKIKEKTMIWLIANTRFSELDGKQGDAGVLV